MSFCRNCGQSLYENAKFCPKCGTLCAEEVYSEPEPESEPVYTEAPLPAVIRYGGGTNGLAVAGFICAFFFPFIGLVLSIVALSGAKTTEYDKPLKGLATWGVVISAVLLVIRIIVIAAAGLVLIPILLRLLSQFVSHIGSIAQ